MPIAMCDRVGLESGMDFAGESIVVGPVGEVLAKADDTPQILHAELDLTRIEEERRRRPYLELAGPSSTSAWWLHRERPVSAR